MPDLIRIQRLVKRYREGERTRVILDGVDASFAAGEFTAILGRSGSGKSTLLNLLAGIDTADAGDIFIGDTRVSALDDRARTLFRRGHIGFVFQFFNLIPTLSVVENVMLPASLAGCSQSESRARAARLLDAVGLAGREAAFPDKLSGGEQQRVAIARALVAEAGLILADEPTGNLDAATGAQILALLLQLTREQARTLVMVTHSREVAAQADRVYWLEQGRLSLQVPPPGAAAAPAPLASLPGTP